MKIKIYVITLNREGDRAKSLEASLKGEIEQFPVHWIEGIRGSALTAEEQITFRGKNRYYKNISNGEVGCYLSHLKCLKQLMDDECDAAVILEDDVQVNPGFGKAIQDLVSRSIEWDLIKLYGGRKAKVVVSASNDLAVVENYPVAISTPAQLWSQKGAETYLQHAQQIERPIDVDLKFVWEHGLTILSTDDDLITIQDVPTEMPDKRVEKTKALRKMGFELQFFLGRFIYGARKFGLFNTFKLLSGKTIVEDKN